MNADGRPVIRLFEGTTQEAENRLGRAARGLCVRHLRAKRMRTVPSLLDEFAASFQFPWYFGHNKDALDECMRDLEWLDPFRRLEILVFDADELLADDPVQRAWFLRAVRLWVQDWGVRPDADGGPVVLTVWLQHLPGVQASFSEDGP